MLNAKTALLIGGALIAQATVGGGFKDIQNMQSQGDEARQIRSH